MHAHRLILTTDESGNLTGLPKLPPHTRVEAILLLDDAPAERPQRKPHPALAGSVITHGDIFSSAPPSDWEPQA